MNAMKSQSMTLPLCLGILILFFWADQTVAAKDLSFEEISSRIDALAKTIDKLKKSRSKTMVEPAMIPIAGTTKLLDSPQSSPEKQAQGEQEMQQAPSVEETEGLSKVQQVNYLLPMVDLEKPALQAELIISEFPRVEELDGQVYLYDEESESFKPVQTGFEITQPILFAVGEDSELVVSFPGQVASRIGAHSRLVIAPAVRGRYEIDLQLGTISAMLDPKRNPSNAPVFAIRTMTGIVEARGTFYAITEYKGQTYSSVKRGKVYKREVPPTMQDFASYAQKIPGDSKIASVVRPPSPSTKN